MEYPSASKAGLGGGSGGDGRRHAGFPGAETGSGLRLAASAASRRWSMPARLHTGRLALFPLATVKNDNVSPARGVG